MQQYKLTLLHEHYKETFIHIQDYLKLRDKLFGFVLVIITLMLFQLYSPAGSANAISELLAKKLELNTVIDITFLSSIFWFALLGLVVRYYQTVVHIERQYDYIHSLEDQLSPEFKGDAFTREGASYLANYPLFSSWVWILYTIVFPTLLSAVVIVKITVEIMQAKSIAVLLCINVLLALCIFLSSVLYVSLVHFRK